MGMRNWMERVGMVVWLISLVHPLRCIYANSEDDTLEVAALHNFSTKLNDSSNVLGTWDKTLGSPCTWNHITCDQYRVIRVDLGNCNLTGQLSLGLGQLENLQYLELYGNNINETIPSDFGNLTNLISLDLYNNRFSGDIPDTLGNLLNLEYLRMENNRLSGLIPMTLTKAISLTQLNLSNNLLLGCVPNNGSFSNFTTTSFANNFALIFQITGNGCLGYYPVSPPGPTPVVP